MEPRRRPMGRPEGHTAVPNRPWAGTGTLLDPDDPAWHAIDRLCRLHGTLVAELGQSWSGRLTRLERWAAQGAQTECEASRISGAIRWSNDEAWLDDDTIIHLLTEPECRLIENDNLGGAIEAIERRYSTPLRRAALALDDPIRTLLRLLEARNRKNGRHAAKVPDTLPVRK